MTTSVNPPSQSPKEGVDGIAWEKFATAARAVMLLPWQGGLLSVARHSVPTETALEHTHCCGVVMTRGQPRVSLPLIPARC